MNTHKRSICKPVKNYRVICEETGEIINSFDTELACKALIECFKNLVPNLHYYYEEIHHD